MRTADFDYDLPLERIAQNPVEPRDAARLLVVDRKTGDLAHRTFRDIVEYLAAGDVLVVNQTRVIPARLYGNKLPGGGKVEVLLLKRLDPVTWEAMVGGKGMHPGRRLDFAGVLQAEILAILDGPERLIRFDEPVELHLDHIGHVPLPPYIHHTHAPAERYQTVYAQTSGSAAAPTAGLHFTPALLERLRGQGITLAMVTLHIGLDTFAPVRVDDPHTHPIHTEWCELTQETADRINQAARVICVGTTSVRTVETAAQSASSSQRVAPYEGPTNLYILPGYHFRAVDALITNFHLPKSTLLMMISAFAGRESVLAAYEIAKQDGYRFFSFGDAMLIL